MQYIYFFKISRNSCNAWQLYKLVPADPGNKKAYISHKNNYVKIGLGGKLSKKLKG